MSIGVEFVGGPLDGEVRVVDDALYEILVPRFPGLRSILVDAEEIPSTSPVSVSVEVYRYTGQVHRSRPLYRHTGNR